MTFDTYNEFQEAVSSEKLLIAFIYPRQSITTWTSIGSNVWTKSVDHVVDNLYQGSTVITKQTSSSVDASNPFFYDITSNTCYYYTTSTLPDDDNLIAEYKLFFSNAPINLSWDLGDTSEEVEYQPRLIKGVGFKSEIGSDQKGISVTGSGNIVLQNNDGHFDSLFDAMIWENKKVEIYSYNRNLAPSLAKIQYKGSIVNKSFNSDKVTFKIQDAIFKLDTKIDMELFDETDGVNESFYGDAKRTIYGKVDGLLCRSIDQVGEGYTLTGTVSGTGASTTVTGSGTSFLTELAQNDEVIINLEEYTVQKVNSDTEFIISDSSGLVSTVSGESITSIPSISNPEFNRDFFVANHAVSQSNTTISSMVQLNRIIVADIEGFEVNDLIKVDGDSFTIFAISGNQIQLNINATSLYSTVSPVIKEPITKIYIDGKQIDIDDLSSITNVTDCSFTLNNKAEFRVTPNILEDDANYTFTAGSRTVVYSGSKELSNVLQERDWIKAEGEADSTYLRIVDIVGTDIRCSETWTGSTASSKKILKRQPSYISDDSPVSITATGKTKDGTSTGILIRTGADVVEDILTGLGLSLDINAASFTEASTDNNMRMSIALPYSISGSAPTARDIINDINQSIFGSLSLTQDLKLSYFINTPERTEAITEINDDDIIKWKFKGKETPSYKRIVGNYKFLDFNNNKEEGNSLIDYTSSHVSDYDISNKIIERDFRVYNEGDATELSQRYIFNNEQTLMELDIEADLRLSDIEIGDRIVVNFARFTNQPAIGDSKRVYLVIGIKKDFNKIDLKLSDLGNLFNRSAVIADNSIRDYQTLKTLINTGNLDNATEQEKEDARIASDELRFSGYITDDNGLITGDDSSKQTNLIN